MLSGPREIPCYFDGACKGNQFEAKGPMWVAYVIGEEEHAHEIPDLASPHGALRSNNIAEYQALTLLLRRMRAVFAGDSRVRFVVQGDSQLVIYQMLGRYRVREEHLGPLHEEAGRLASGLPIAFRWVPRAKNRAGQLLESH